MSDHIGHKPTSITHLLNPVVLSPAPPSPAPDHGLPHTPPHPIQNGAGYVNGAQHSPVPPHPAHEPPRSRVGKLTAASWDQAGTRTEYGGRGQDSMYRYASHPSQPPYLAMPAARSHLRPRDDPYARSPAQWAAPAGVDPRVSSVSQSQSMSAPASVYIDEQASQSGDGPPSAPPSPYPGSRVEYANVYRPESSMQTHSTRHPSHPLHASVWPPEYGVSMRVDARLNPYAHYPPMYPVPHPPGPHYYPHPYLGMWYYGIPYPPPPPHVQHVVSAMPSPAPPSSSRKRTSPNGDEGSPKLKKRRSPKSNHLDDSPAYKKGIQNNRDDSLPPTEDGSTGSKLSLSQGPLHPELQFARCMSNRYKPENFPRCVSCTRRWAGDTCRFQGIRFFLKNDQGDIMGASFVENPRPDGPSMNFPTRWDRPLDATCIQKIKRTVAMALLPTLKHELEHLNKANVIRRPREADVQATCDTCMTSIFALSWMCRLCGREACADCFEKVRELTQNRPGASDSEIALLQAKREGHAHSNPFFLSCTRRNEHGFSDFLPTSRFHKPELLDVVKAMEEMLGKEKERRLEQAENGVEGEGKQVQDVVEDAGAPVVPIPANGEVVGAGPSIFPVAVPAGEEVPCDDTDNSSMGTPFDSDQGYHSSTPSLPDGIASHNTPTFTNDALTEDEFQKALVQGHPLVVSGLQSKLPPELSPSYLMDKCGSQTCTFVECQGDANRKGTVGEFFVSYGQYGDRGKERWKLKDWPSASEAKSALPELYEDVARLLPMPSYCRRDGVMNLASHFPTNTVAPDLGPHVFIAQAALEGDGSKGTTRLHVDVADCVNVMVHAAACPDGTPGCAAWDVFRSEDTGKLRKYLKRRLNNAMAHDPILSGTVYVDERMRRELQEEFGVESHRIYQRPGEGVIVPAGCAHQVTNMADSIKVGMKFVSADNVGRCEKLMGEYREQNQSMSWREDSLQLRTMMWFAWLSCSRQEEDD